MSEISIFETKLGWFGMIRHEQALARLVFGHASAADVLRDAARSEDRELTAIDWHPALRERLQAYAAGAPDDFRDVELDAPQRTPFQIQVLRKLRSVGYGRTTTYGELASRAGRPRAARAVGTIMSHNCVPIIIPCHRVLAAGGAVGGYSAPQGIALKRRLLDLESNGRR